LYLTDEGTTEIVSFSDLLASILHIADVFLFPQLRKFWMPLKEFTEHEVAGLRRGDVAIPIGTAAQGYERFNEKEKLEEARKMYARMSGSQ
jgi:hypothetical protein